MWFSRFVTSRTMLVTVALVAALVVAPRSGVALSAGHGVPLITPTTSPATCPPPSGNGPPYCYEIVTYTPGPNFITGINVDGVIVGAYTNGNSYSSFAATPSQKPINSLLPYTTFAPERDIFNTYLGGLDDGNGNGNNVTTEFFAGYVANSLNAGTKGAIFNPGNTTSGGGWSLYQEPNQATSGSCAVTEVLAINDSRIGVGFYETNPTSGSAGCVKHAFEFYGINKNIQGPLTYVDLTPNDPFGCAQDATSSVATGISPLGDVVGSVSCNTSSSAQTAAWIYKDLKYTTFCYPAITCTTTSEPATYANGINFSHTVVGDYTDSNGHQHGFTIDPTLTSPTFYRIDIPGMVDTVLWSLLDATQTGQLNENTFWAGWAINSNGVAKGIVGMCEYPAAHCL